MIRDFLDRKIIKWVNENILPTLTKIDIQPGKGMFNYRCHRNAVQYSYDNREVIFIEKEQDSAEEDVDLEYTIKVIATIVTNEDNTFIHFINLDDRDNLKIYIDNTLGVFSQKYDYYLLEEISVEEYLNIDDIMHEIKVEIISKLPWYLRLPARLYSIDEFI